MIYLIRQMILLLSDKKSSLFAFLCLYIIIQQKKFLDTNCSQSYSFYLLISNRATLGIVLVNHRVGGWVGRFRGTLVEEKSNFFSNRHIRYA